MAEQSQEGRPQPKLSFLPQWPCASGHYHMRSEQSTGARAVGSGGDVAPTGSGSPALPTPLLPPSPFLPPLPSTPQNQEQSL